MAEGNQSLSLVQLPSSNQRLESSIQTKKGDAMAESPSRDEISARLEAAEARTETRIANLTGSIDARFLGMDHKLDKIADAVTALTDTVIGVKSDNKYTRWTIVVVVVASILAGLAALWTTQGNMLASFSAGLAGFQAKQDLAKSNEPKSDPQKLPAPKN